MKLAEPLNLKVDGRVLEIRGATHYVGRDPSNHLHLEDPSVSRFHARIDRRAERFVLVDLGSRHGTWVNDARVTEWTLSPRDVVDFGDVSLVVESAGGAIEMGTGTLDPGNVPVPLPGNVPVPLLPPAGFAIGAEGLTLEVGGRTRLLHALDLQIRPGEMVGLLGPSGSGKSTLLNLLIGALDPSEGRVLYDGVDLALIEGGAPRIGFVPQDDVLHLELTVRETLTYGAALRLGVPVESPLVRERVEDVIHLVELQGREDQAIASLSGGQRKRVSVALELVTQPGALFLDEPTTGLDPGLEYRMTCLFRSIASAGRTVVISTHIMENVPLFDRVAVLVRGEPVFIGTPAKLLEYFDIEQLPELYPVLESRPVREWRERFDAQPHDPTGSVSPHASAEGLISNVKHDRRIQLITLARRYFRSVVGDRKALIFLLMQAPIIGGLLAVLAQGGVPDSLVRVLLCLAAIWLGCSNAVREIIKEKGINKREFAIGVRAESYLLSKAAILGGLTSLQVVLLLVVASISVDPGSRVGMLALICLLTAWAGMALGLVVSALVGTTDRASSLAPIVLIPQVLLCGVFPIREESLADGLSWVMALRWAREAVVNLTGSQADLDLAVRGLAGQIPVFLFLAWLALDRTRSR